jgi:hypothetical protein
VYATGPEAIAAVRAPSMSPSAGPPEATRHSITHCDQPPPERHALTGCTGRPLKHRPELRSITLLGARHDFTQKHTLTLSSLQSIASQQGEPAQLCLYTAVCCFVVWLFDAGYELTVILRKAQVIRAFADADGRKELPSICISHTKRICNPLAMARS